MITVRTIQYMRTIRIIVAKFLNRKKSHIMKTLLKHELMIFNLKQILKLEALLILFDLDLSIPKYTCTLTLLYTAGLSSYAPQLQILFVLLNSPLLVFNYFQLHINWYLGVNCLETPLYRVYTVQSIDNNVHKL